MEKLIALPLMIEMLYKRDSLKGRSFSAEGFFNGIEYVTQQKQKNVHDATE